MQPPPSTKQTSHSRSFNFNDQHEQTFNQNQLPAIVQVQRKLLAFFYVYATLVVTLYLTYAIYCYYQHTNNNNNNSSANQIISNNNKHAEQLISSSSNNQEDGKISQENKADLEQKLHLLERYIEMIALDLEETKSRLREREKCACSQRCTFNGTIYQDGQTWQQKPCDICTCSSGKISCSPKKCPKLECNNPIQLAGQCCPTCMKNCKWNKSLLKHGEIVKSRDSIKTKQCKCNDGIIKCEPIQSNHNNSKEAQNKTMEYLKTIIASPQLVKLKS